MGITLASCHKQRVHELCQLEHSLLYISGELRYRQSVLADVFGQAAMRSKGVLKQWFLTLQSKLEQTNDTSMQAAWSDTCVQAAWSDTCVQAAWSEALQHLKEISHLKSTELLILESIGGMLGCVDLDTQVKELELATEQLHDVRTTAERNLANKMKVTVSLCIVATILLIILCI